MFSLASSTHPRFSVALDLDFSEKVRCNFKFASRVK
jgi:hypothetical protein